MQTWGINEGCSCPICASCKCDDCGKQLGKVNYAIWDNKKNDININTRCCPSCADYYTNLKKLEG